MRYVLTNSMLFFFCFNNTCSRTPAKARTGSYPGNPIQDHAKELSPGDFVYIGEKSNRYVCEVKEVFPTEEGSGIEGSASLSMFEWPKRKTFHWNTSVRKFELAFSDIKTILRPPYIFTISSRRVGFVFKDLIDLIAYEDTADIDFGEMQRYEDYLASKKTGASDTEIEVD